MPGRHAFERLAEEVAVDLGDDLFLAAVDDAEIDLGAWADVRPRRRWVSTQSREAMTLSHG